MTNARITTSVVVGGRAGLDILPRSCEKVPELGMVRAKTADGSMTFVVGRYRPAGNVIDYMAENEFPKITWMDCWDNTLCCK